MTSNQTNENPAEKNQTEEVPKTKNKTKDIILGVLIVSLLSTWAYIIWDKNNTRELVQQKDNIINSTSNEKDELQKELEDATLRYEDIKSDNASKDSMIAVRDKEIEDKKIRIRSILSKMNASETELKEAKALIESLNTDIEQYKVRIALLESEKTELTRQNEQITAEKNKIQKDYDSSVEKLKDRENTIDIGSTLHASNFKVVGLAEKSGGKTKETTTAKKVDKLKISFDLDENMIASSGTKILYVIITDPTGKVFTANELGTGKIVTRDNTEKDFTQKVEVNYVQNKRQTVSFDWKSMEVFKTGNYKIEVYNNGFKIGEGTRPLKKGGIFG